MLTGFVIGDRLLNAAGDTHPAWMMAHAEIGSYLVVGASTVGRIHLARRSPRDDAFVIRSVGSWLAVAVADGVGSRPLSRYGAAYVVESLTTQLLRKLAPPVRTIKEELNRDSSLPFSAIPSIPDRDEGELKELAPPPTAEEIELKVSITSPTLNRADEIAALSSVREHVRQVGSMAWWPSSDVFPATQVQHPQGTTSSPQFKSPLKSGVDEQNEGDHESASMPQEPDLLQILEGAFNHTHRTMENYASSLGLELADLSCTALALLLNVETGRLAVGQIGDGALLALTAQGKVVELIQAPGTGDPQSVYTINRPNFGKYLVKSVIEPSAANPYVAFYVMSDGISHDLLYASQPMEPWTQAVNTNLLESPSPAIAAAGMLRWLSTYRVKGSWDDRTLVVITQRQENNGDSQPLTGQS